MAKLYRERRPQKTPLLDRLRKAGAIPANEARHELERTARKTTAELKMSTPIVEAIIERAKGLPRGTIQEILFELTRAIKDPEELEAMQRALERSIHELGHSI